MSRRNSARKARIMWRRSRNASSSSGQSLENTACQFSELPTVHQRFLDELSKIERGAETLEAARKAAEGAAGAYAKAADALSDKRRATATLLTRRFNKSWPRCGLKKRGS